MNPQRVLIIGNRLFADALRYLLAEKSSIIVVDTISTIEECVDVINDKLVDTLIIAQSLLLEESSLCELITNFPEKTIIKAHLEKNHLEVISRHSIQARSQDLLSTLAALPRYSE